jgi:hypothetical protein
MSNSLTIIIIDKQASLKTLTIKDYKVEELYKKCGFKKAEGFNLQVEWPVKVDGRKYFIQMYGKLDGKANFENKYDFPPPVDKKLYFGSCALVGLIQDNSNKIHTNLTIELWNKIYEKLFGGFEDLVTTSKEDEEEEDELDNIPKHKKTKVGGYLKDGFVVDSSDTEDDASSCSVSDSETNVTTSETSVDDEEVIIEEVGSELSEEEYIDSDKE